jgi:predicted ATPase
MPAPYLRRVWLDPAAVADPDAYPFCLPFLRNEFELNFDRPITIIAGENGTGKSTLLEGIAVLSGFDDAGGGKGYRAVDHSDAHEVMGGELAQALRAGWLPKISNGWFFRAETFFSIARYLGSVGSSSDCPTRMARGFCASSRSAASGRASSSSTSPKPRCRRRGRWNS